MKINYRSAQYEDIEDIIKIRLKYLIEYTGGLDENTIQELKINMKSYLKEHLNKDCFVELAYKDDEVISSVILNIIEKVPSQRFMHGKFGEIYGVYTRVDYRKQGIASKLMERMVRKEQFKELSFIKLEASKLGCGIYEKCGFQYVKNNEYTEMKYYIEK